MQPRQIDILPSSPAPPDLSPAWLRFALFCTLFLLAAIWLEPHMAPLCRVTAAQVGALLGLGGYVPRVQGDLITVSGFTVRIVTECTSLYACLLYGAFVLAQPASWRRNLAGLFLGILIITAANLLRISFVAAAGSVVAPILFDILHVYLGQVAMLLLVVAAALVWLRWSVGGTTPLPFLLRAGFIATVLFVPWLLINRGYVAQLDTLVAFLFHRLYPGHQLLMPRPFPIYNHTFAVPLLLSLVVAGWKPWTVRRVAALCGGICLIAGWHALFRVSHVVWTALHVTEIEPLHQAIYLLGQFMLPFLLWFRLDGRLLRPARTFTVPGKPLIIALLLLCSVSKALAIEPVILIHPTGGGGFVLKADNLNRVTEAEIRIDYQSADSTPPLVSGAGLGAQATIAVQNDTPGSIIIRVKSIKPLNGHVLLAMAQIWGRVTFMTAWLRFENGMTLTPRISIINPSPEELKAMAAQQQQKEVPAVVAATPVLTAQKYAPSVAASPGVILPLSTPAGATVIKDADSDYTLRNLAFSRRRSLVDAFRNYSGEQTPAAFAKLFERSDTMFRQEPSLLLSDGAAALLLTVRPHEQGGRAPQFLISGGSCTGLEVANDGAWVLEIVPEQGSMTTTVTVLTGSEMIEFPLAVAPPLELFEASKAGAGEAEYVRAANSVVRAGGR